MKKEKIIELKTKYKCAIDLEKGKLNSTTDRAEKRKIKNKIIYLKYKLEELEEYDYDR